MGDWLRSWTESFRSLYDVLRRLLRDYGGLRDPLRVRSQYSEQKTLRLGRIIARVGGIEQQGIDGRVLTLGAFTALTARFAQQDVGKFLRVLTSGVAGNNITFRVVALVDVHTVLTDPVIAADAGPFKWQLHASRTAQDNTFTVEVMAGDLEDVGPGDILFDGTSEFVVRGRRQFRHEATLPLLETFGQDGALIASDTLKVARDSFVRADLDKRIVISGTEESDGTYRIETVVDARTVTLTDVDGDPVSLALASAVDWGMRSLPELDLEGTADLLGQVTQQGVDLEITGVDTVVVVSARFSQEDVGKLLTIRESALGNDGTYEIVSVTSENVLVLDTASLVPEADLGWIARVPSLVGDLTQVTVRSASLLALFAQDFGIEIDTQESQARQRSWVRHVSQWLDLKGTQQAYEVMGLLSGFDVEVANLWHITRGVAAIVGSGHVFEVGEIEAGRYGEDGTLSFVTGTGLVFSSPTAVFRFSDVGRFVRITDGATSSNNNRHSIVEWLTKQSVKLSALDGAVAPDANNGALTWRVAALYTDRPPQYPYFDEIWVEKLEEIVDTESGGALAFRVDKPCWESDWSSDVAVSVLTTVHVESNMWDVTVVDATVSGFLNGPAVVQGIGRWKLVIGADEWWLETVPVETSPGEYTFAVRAAPPPAGTGVLRYACDTILFGDGYCAASRVLLRITYGSIATETGQQIENAQWRFIRRVTDEVKPAHVALVPVIQATLQASLSLSATVEDSSIGGAPLYAPLTALYDDIEGDVIETDVAIRAFVET